MNRSGTNAKEPRAPSRTFRALQEISGLLRAPQRMIPLVSRLTADRARMVFENRNLYSFTTGTIRSGDVLRSVMRWILSAQRADGGIPAYYSYLTGYSESYPEVTGYIIPTLYAFSHLAKDATALSAAERATKWLLSLQMASGAFPAGLDGAGGSAQPSVFNSGQILQGLVAAYAKTGDAKILERAAATGDWLANLQQPDGSWSGPGAYQGNAHTYYSMVAWALALLAAASGDPRHAAAAERNIDWVLKHIQPSGWIDGINLRGHPAYLHFIAYVIQGMLECAVLLHRDDAVEASAKSAWVLLRKFETGKKLLGAYEPDFRRGQEFTCLTGNAQMSCVWLRLFDVTGDPRYLNAALKMNEMLKTLVPTNGRLGVAGGVAGSRPIWGAYQPLRLISWGGKFFADALMLEQQLLSRIEASECA